MDLLDSLHELEDLVASSSRFLLTNKCLANEEELIRLISNIRKEWPSALKEAEEKNICGKNVTPFLLDKVKTITDGKSLESNIELVYNNAKVAAQIAKDLSDINNN